MGEVNLLKKKYFFSLGKYSCKNVSEGVKKERSNIDKEKIRFEELTDEP